MNQEKNNQQNSQTQRKSKFRITLDLSEHKSVKDIPHIDLGIGAPLQKMFEENFPALTGGGINHGK